MKYWSQWGRRARFEDAHPNLYPDTYPNRNAFVEDAVRRYLDQVQDTVAVTVRIPRDVYELLQQPAVHDIIRARALEIRAYDGCAI